MHIHSFYRFIRANFLHRFIKSSDKKINSTKNLNIEIIGFFESNSGIGESARLCANALKDDGFKVKCTTVEKIFRKNSQLQWSKVDFFEDLKPDLRIFHLNPPMLPPVIFSLGLKNFAKTYNIGYWAWELEDIPKEWKKAINYMNAIFTPSNFTSGVISKYTNKPVYTVMHPVSVINFEMNIYIRQKLKIPNDAFLISSIFSFGSALERKNPQALIEAFKLAFQRNENAYLVLKSNSSSIREKQEIESLISDDNNIMLIDENWSSKDVFSLIKTSSLYASLHRSEGFGLTIAESLLLDTPVMVTDWSGSTGFCNQKNAFLVDYALIPVNSSHPEYANLSDLHWANPNIKRASFILKSFYDRRSEIPFPNQKIDTRLTLNNYSYKKAMNKLFNNSIDL